MLGRKQYSQEEIDTGRNTIRELVESYDSLRAAVPKSRATATAEFEAHFFNNLVLTLDRCFVHRLSGPNYEGKDGNPLNEVRIICDSLLTNGGRLRSDKQIKLPPEKSRTGLAVGEEIRLSREQFDHLADGFFAEIERRFR